MSTLQDAVKAAYEKILELEFTSENGKIAEILKELAAQSGYHYAHLFCHEDKEGIYFSNVEEDNVLSTCEEVLIFAFPFEENFIATMHNLEADKLPKRRK